MKIFVDIHIAPVTNDDQKRILITNPIATTENSCDNLATTKKIQSLQCEQTTSNNQNFSIAPYYGDKNFSITIKRGCVVYFWKKHLMKAFQKHMTCPLFLVAIGHWGCVEW
jgi:hypothetical protein